MSEKRIRYAIQFPDGKLSLTADGRVRTFKTSQLADREIRRTIKGLKSAVDNKKFAQSSRDRYAFMLDIWNTASTVVNL